MAEYGSMFLVSVLAAILFFGGWNGPIPIFGPNALNWAYAPGAADWSVTGYLATAAGCMNLIMKAVVGVTVMMWVRWSLPRLRIDQVMTTCLKYCVPLAAFCFLGALFWQLNALPTMGGVAPALPGGRAAWRESWVYQQASQAAKPAAAPAEEPAKEEPAKSAGSDKSAAAKVASLQEVAQ